MTTRYLSLLLVVIALQGSTCLDNKNVLPGNVYEMTDASFTKCDPYLGIKGHDCLLISNPQKGILRVFDATDNQFILSPIGYRPLAVPVGEQPTSIATSAKEAFVLDSVGGNIYSIPTTNQQNGLAAFRKADVTKKFPLLASSNRIFLTSTSELLVQVGADKIYNANTSTECLDLSPAIINHIAIDPQGKQLAIGTDTGFLLVDIASKAKTPIDVGGAVQRVAIGTDFSLALMRDSNDVVIIKNNSITGKVTISGRPLAAYIPEGTANKLPNNSENPWIAVLTSSGDLQYVDLVTLKAIEPAQVSNKIAAVLNNNLGYPIKILGTTVDNKRKMFLVYSRFIGSLIEGETEKIDIVALY